MVVLAPSCSDATLHRSASPSLTWRQPSSATGACACWLLRRPAPVRGTLSRACTPVCLLPLDPPRPRHIDHSVGLVAAAEDISKALAGASEAGTSSSGCSVVFDLHAHRPHRRGLQLPHQQIVPFNPVRMPTRRYVAGSTRPVKLARVLSS
jgi:hypothetical protein